MINRYLQIKDKIKNVCLKNQIDPSSVQVLAVSKKQSVEKIRLIYEQGQTDFGENYVQEAIEKKKQLEQFKISWHFIGHLQKNKVKDVVGNFDLIHSVDSLELANRISIKAGEKGIKQKILLELNLAEETSKSGFNKNELEAHFQKLSELPNLTLSGLMFLPPAVDDPERSRPFFREARTLYEGLLKQLLLEKRTEWKILSMGTSQDYLVAIQEGANIVRIGTSIFGERE